MLRDRASFYTVCNQSVKSVFCYIVVFICATLTLIPASIFANIAYVTSYNSGKVAMIDTDSNTALPDLIRVGRAPIAIAATPDGKFVYVANNESLTVSAIYVRSDDVIPIAVGNSPFGVAITPNGAFAYVTNLLTNTVSVITIGLNSIKATISGFNFPQGIAVTPDGKFVYVTNRTANANALGFVSIIDVGTNTIVGSPISVGKNPKSIAITPNGDFAYVTNYNDNNISVISTNTRTVVTTITSGQLGPTAVAITPSGSYAYVSNLYSNSVSVINTNTNTSEATISGFNAPQGLAITSDGNSVYVTNSLSSVSTVAVVTTGLNTITSTISFSGQVKAPVAIAIAPDIVPPFPIPPSPPEPNSEHADQENGAMQERNDFGLSYELFNVLNWQPSPSEVACYFVYRDGVKIATLSNSTLTYADHNRLEGVTTFYSVTAVGFDGIESAPLHFRTN